MLVGEVETPGVDVVVIPDRPEFEAQAAAIVTRLQGAGVASEMAYRGNAKRRVEIAGRNGARSLLFVRLPEASGGQYYLKYLGSDIAGLRALSDTVQKSLDLDRLYSGTV